MNWFTETTGIDFEDAHKNFARLKAAFLAARLKRFREGTITEAQLRADIQYVNDELETPTEGFFSEFFKTLQMIISTPTEIAREGSRLALNLANTAANAANNFGRNYATGAKLTVAALAILAVWWFGSKLLK